MIGLAGRPSVAVMTRFAALAVLAALAGTVALGGCGAVDGAAGIDPAAASASGTPNPTGAAAGSVHRITAEDLPDGWRDSQPRRSGYRLTVCGVDLEPQPPVGTDELRFAQSGVGPFLEQYVRTYDSDRVTAVIEGLQAALPTCTRFTAGGDGEDARVEFTVEPLDVPGLAPDDVAWRQTSVAERPITADYLITRRGTSAVVLVSYAISGPPPSEVLDAAYRAVRSGT